MHGACREVPVPIDHGRKGVMAPMSPHKELSCLHTQATGSLTHDR